MCVFIWIGCSPQYSPRCSSRSLLQAPGDGVLWGQARREAGGAGWRRGGGGGGRGSEGSPGGAGAARAALSRAEPSQIGLSHAESSRAESSQTVPSRAGASCAQAVPSRAKAGCAEPCQSEPNQAAPSRAKLNQAAPSQAELPRAEPSRAVRAAGTPGPGIHPSPGAGGERCLRGVCAVFARWMQEGGRKKKSWRAAGPDEAAQAPAKRKFGALLVLLVLGMLLRTLRFSDQFWFWCRI